MIGMESYNNYVEKGAIEVDVGHVEHIGRDVSVVGSVAQSQSKIRIIVSSDYKNDIKKDKLTFSPKRFYVFEENGERIK